MPARRFTINAIAAALIAFGAGVPRPAAGQVPPPAKKAAPAQTADSANSSAVELKQLVGRLNRADRELVEQHAKSGQLPVEKQDRRVIFVLDSPFLGSEYYGSNTNPRFLVARLTLINLSDQPIESKREDVRLNFEGVAYSVKEATESLKNRPFQAGQNTVQLRSLPMPAELNVASGARGSTWLLFPDLPPGNHVPAITLKFKYGAAEHELDVIASERNVLGVKIERLGPRQCLGLVRIAGTLNTINVGTLVDELDRLAGDRVVRAVIVWGEGSSISELTLSHWLQNSAIGAGRAQQFNEQQFPGLPASLREMHLARLPNSNPGENQTSAYPSNYVPVTAAVAVQRIHKTESEAVVAALRTAYEALPRDEVLRAIQSGTAMERAAALAGGAGRLPADKLPVVLKYTDDADPVIQQAAIQALANFGERDALTKLVSCARSESPLVAATAISGLASSRYEAAHAALLELLAGSPSESKKTIVKILAAHPRPAWSDAIFAIVKDPQSGLSAEALGALVQIGHPQLLSVLADALRGNDANLKMQAFSILAARTDPDSEALAVEFTLEHLQTKPAAPGMLPLLDRVKDPRALPLLLSRFGDTQNKAELIQTLAKIGDEQTAKFLIGRYAALQNHEKGEVLRFLVRFDPAGFRQLAPQALQSADNALVSQATQGLQEDGSAEAILILIDGLEKGTGSFVWSYVANALAGLGTPECRAALRKARDDGGPEKRPFAVNALIAIRQRSPGFPFYQLGQQQSQANNLKEALEHYDSAIQLDPELSDAWSGRGHVLLQQERFAEVADGKLDDAVKKLETDRHKFQNNAIFNYNAACVYGRAYEHLHKNPKAENRDKLMNDYKQAALADIRKSLDMGFDDVELMKKDPDLKLLLELPEFQELIKNLPEPAKAAAVPRGPQAQRARRFPPRGF
ncbi:MAG: HEAT repeat domain-containing protein [Planctomycetia bacterium]|nr:HEAT repeat domain-containing protein [Planctomycetia bacterium]